MDNPDTLYVILTKMPEAALVSMMRNSATMALVADAVRRERFWYERSKNIVGKQLTYRTDVDWRDMYRILRDMNYNTYWTVLHDLPTLLVFEEAGGEIPEEMDNIMRDENLDVDVLRYIMAMPDREYKPKELVAAINKQVEYNQNEYPGREEVINYLVELIPADYKFKDAVSDILALIIRKGYITALTKLHRYIDSRSMDRMLALAGAGNQVEVAKYLLSNFEYNRIDLLNGLSGASGSGAIEATHFFLDLAKPSDEEIRNNVLFSALRDDSVASIKELEKLITIDWTSTLDRTVKYAPRKKTKVLKYVLDHISPTQDLGYCLLEVVRSVDTQMLSLLLEDPRTHASDHITELLDAIKDVPVFYKQEISKAIARSSAVSVETISSENAMKLAYGMKQDEELARMIGRGGDLSSILCKILFDQPTSIELLKWMNSKKRQDAVLASRLVVDSSLKLGGASNDVLIIRALLLSLLYPTLQDDVALQLLLQEGYSYALINPIRSALRSLDIIRYR